MTNSLLFGRAQVANPFDSNRAAEEFSTIAMLANIVFLMVLIVYNQVLSSQDNRLVTVALDLLTIPPLLYYTQWLRAYLFELGEKAQKVLFGLFGLAMVGHLIKVVLA